MDKCSKDGERPCHRRRTRRRQESRFGPADVTTSLASATRSDTCSLGTSYLNYHDLFLFSDAVQVFTLFHRASEVKRLEERLPTYGTLRFEHENILMAILFFLFVYTEERAEWRGLTRCCLF